MKILPLVALLALCAVAADAARTQLLRIHEVTQQEYNDLLRLTRGGSQVSESRLLRSPLSGLANIAHSLSFESNKPSSAAKRYPLCVVSSQDRQVKYGRHITWKVGGSNNDDKFEYEGGAHDDDDDVDDTDKDKDKDDEAERPVVNCIVVVKNDNDDEKDSSHKVVTTRKPTVSPHPGPPDYTNTYPLELWQWYQQFGKWLSQLPCDPKVQRCP
ncbi:uncharacterized protein LOC108652656 [Drosophila navojoa]|uniref:uncharacterized protein LOC108652656 n=1 Tax=Drosophila navojoa TaxID=7232 RepID=UPI000846B89B|nr:uncharacterized protein LOC108652656 [Drosophila navojoa]